MKKGIALSLVCAAGLVAAEVELETIDVATSVDTEVVKDVSGEDIKSADLGEALFKQSASVSLVRRSGVANDIILRGQKKDNINVTIDGAKIYGACPNRMDPPISHVLTNNVDYIEINEGPFNVEDFGSLSGDVKVHTIKPSEEFAGEIDLGAGSWGYQKGAFSLSGGTDKVRVLLSGSTEKAGQYEDGDGNDFSEQITENGIMPTMNYQDPYKNMDAYEKKTMMTKLFWDITDNQELRLSYTANRSDNVLYPSTMMDALYDDSDIYNMEYIAKDLGAYSKELNMQVYQSEVEHPMSTYYRKSADNNLSDGVWDSAKEMIAALRTKMQGAKLKNSFDAGNHTITTGLDFSKRTWDGEKYMASMPGMATPQIDDAETKNSAIFLKDKIKLNQLVVDLGLRYDHTTTADANSTHQDNTYNEVTGYLFGTYYVNTTTSYFIGAGKSSRVPDPRELYYIDYGTPTLNNTINYEFDMGAKKEYENAMVKGKVFYSNLDDFILFNGSTFENIDAKIYGFELSGMFMVTNALYFDYGMAYQRGKKDDGSNMPEIPPFKLNASVNYETDTLALKAEVIASDSWSDFDGDNKEQQLDGYAILNLKGTQKFGKHFELTLGVDNVFDETYAVSNTYQDLKLLATGTDVMLLNEPGRYFYTNLKYKF